MSNPITAKKIIFLHKNPVIETTSFGKKIFIPKNTEDEIENVNKSLEMLRNILSAERVEKKSARATAEWIPELNRAKIIKRIGHITQFGYNENKNFFLLPEEALFLLEMNRLELSYNGIPFSIEQAYTNLLGNDNCSIKQYRIYQKLAQQGFHVKEELINTECDANNSDEERSSAKKVRLEKSRKKNNDTNCCIYSSSSSHKKLTHKLRLQSNNDSLDSESISSKDYSVLTSFSGVDSVAFYQLQAIDFDIK